VQSCFYLVLLLLSLSFFPVSPSPGLPDFIHSPVCVRSHVLSFLRRSCSTSTIRIRDRQSFSTQSFLACNRETLSRFLRRLRPIEHCATRPSFVGTVLIDLGFALETSFSKRVSTSRASAKGCEEKSISSAPSLSGKSQVFRNLFFVIGAQ
jgi:hypothetical protein